MDLFSENLTLELPQALTEPSRRRVLILEDDPALRRILWKTFVGWDWYAFAAATVQEAELLAAEQGTSDLVLSDYHLPDGTGLDFLQWLAKRGTSIPPFILMSADPTGPFNSRATRLQKPFSVEELRVIVNLALGCSAAPEPS